MYRGKRLTKNSTIGIISPASPSTPLIIEKYIKNFKNLGFKIKLGDCLYKENNYLTDTDENRAKEIMNMFKDPEIDGIIAFRGGYGCIRLLKYLDIDIIKKNPKFFCGFSDLTILLNYLSDNDIITFHGPMIKSNFNDPITFSYLNKLMFNPSKGLIYNLDTCEKINKNFSGILKGGNLSVICSSIGTPYEINLNDSILLLEEINESPYKIDRLLTQLILSNKLNTCNGILLGHFTSCDDKHISQSKLIELIKNILTPLGIPIISNVQFGHDYPNITFPIGCKGEFNYKTNKLILIENALT